MTSAFGRDGPSAGRLCLVIGNSVRKILRQDEKCGWPLSLSPERAFLSSHGLRSWHSTSIVFQVVFNEISAAELSQLPTMAQLDLLDEFQVDPADLDSIEESDAYGVIERKGKKLYRYRAKDMRLYFQVSEGCIVVHRVLHKNTLQDFLYRSKLPLAEDEAVSQSKVFWELIEEGQNARRV